MNESLMEIMPIPSSLYQHGWPRRVTDASMTSSATRKHACNCTRVGARLRKGYDGTNKTIMTTHPFDAPAQHCRVFQLFRGGILPEDDFQAVLTRNTVHSSTRNPGIHHMLAYEPQSIHDSACLQARCNQSSTQQRTSSDQMEWRIRRDGRPYPFNMVQCFLWHFMAFHTGQEFLQQFVVHVHEAYSIETTRKPSAEQRHPTTA
jgi:hypothetical protein